MTKREFYDYIDSFGKVKGTYNDEEVYLIALALKSLDQKDRDWQEMINLLGLPYTKDYLRKKIYRRQLEETKGEKHADLWIEQQKNRDLITTYRATLRDEARLEVFKEELKECVNNLAPLPLITLYESKKCLNNEMVLGFSDLHLGACVNNSYNQFDYDIAVKRVNTLVNKVITYCRENDVKRLTFLNMGDLISGNIHLTIRLNNTLDLVEQIIKASELVAQALNQLQSACPEIIYKSVVDNHSRATPNKNEHIEKENFNKIIDWYVEERLKNTKIKFPHDNIDIGVGRVELLNGQKLLFSHGHQDSKSSVFQNMVGLTNEIPDYIFLAHYHNGAEHTFQNCKVYVNGSIIGTDDYAYSRRLFSKPEQKALIFKGNDIIDINIRL